ncbi:MAG TPA: acetyl-CoA carboxylase biotin carboxyl carrier protein subunit [Bacteroidales bacterium]|nr:acetyl-CoA carboxylase biotin carboxyl carrier protein subunit [Bacteroidales bacterium]HPI67617.1 acetyl-CoA carboxylase biotin carboxyl carrier protein subunit [Bacteroidales bacterium]HPR72078.1 acetyl-CoA carboxylase biotin carboxyl carrier protein subunit [Bacteroidales bacterium]
MKSLEKDEKELEVLNIDSTLYKTRLSKKFKEKKPYKTPDHSIVSSFIPGTVLDVVVREGQDVKKGDTLIIVEAMKMKNHIKSAREGTVKKIYVKKNDKIAKGNTLLELNQI